MLCRGVTCLLLGALAWGQAADSTSPPPAAPAQNPAAQSNPQPAAPPAETKAPEAANIPPDGAVITIQGLCDNPPADKTKASDCKTVITRAEFEKLELPIRLRDFVAETGDGATAGGAS